MADDPTGEWRFNTPTFSERAFRPFALAMGQANLAWNDLHEHLGRMFGLVMPGKDRSQPLAVWQSSMADRAKREMLRAALPEAPQGIHDAFPKLKVELDWVPQRATALEDTRNNIVHGPLHLTHNVSVFGEGKTPQQIKDSAHVAPLDWGGNPRASKLSAKDVLSEYRYLRDSAICLRNYVIQLDKAMSDEARAWPDRPKLPVHRRTVTRQSNREV